jgi:hypothetical protein
MKLNTRRVIAIATSLVITASVIVGLILAGPPSEQRALRIDQDRLNHLMGITYDIDNFWNREKRLPDSLMELTQNRFSSATTRDPETGAEYEYIRTSEKTYDLCAVFSLPSLPEEDPRRLNYGSPMSFWDHGAGRACFTIDVVKRQQESDPGMVKPAPIY